MNAQTQVLSRRATWLRATALAAITAAAWIGGAARAPAAHDSAEPQTLPPLSTVEGVCNVARKRAATEACQAEADALGAIARYPFDPHEGPRALTRLRDAERCFLDAGDDASAARTAGRARNWAARMDRDYRDHATRYRRALASGRTQQALTEIDILLALLAQPGGAFADHLRRTQDALSAQRAPTQEPP